MWLINTENLNLESFQQCPADSYAILSHTWGSDADELDFDLFKAGQGRQKPGFRKIQLCCEQAQKDGLKYAWVDTCCIDKRSSTELSEAINSMFNWYQSARLCYVYLSDVYDLDFLAPEERHTGFLASRWFTRGWTLQELIAPQTVVFYSYEWTVIGNRTNLAQDLHVKTRIALEVLTSGQSYQNYSIAQRMSWASSRETTRPEDIAYCLIGLFDVNMPLLYGEGQKAFMRLQEEIIRQTDDETIFAWTKLDDNEHSGLLASHPAQFVDSVDIRTERQYDNTPHSMTPRGVSLECQMLPLKMNTYLVLLQCHKEVSGSETEPLGILVCRTSDDLEYRRVPARGLWLIKTDRRFIERAVRSTIFVRDTDASRPSPYTDLAQIFVESNLRAWSHPTWNTYRPLVWSRPVEVTQLNATSEDLEEGFILAFDRSARPSAWYRYWLEIGFDRDFRPICMFYPYAFRLSKEKFWKGIFFDLPWLHLPRQQNFWSTDKHNCQTWNYPGTSASLRPCPTCEKNFMLNGFSRSQWGNCLVAHRAEGDRIKGLRLCHFKKSCRASECVQIDIIFKPLDGLHWCLQVYENPLHPGARYMGLCFTCVLGLIYDCFEAFLWCLGFALLLVPTIFVVTMVCWGTRYRLTTWLNLDDGRAFYLAALIIFWPLYWIFTVMWFVRFHQMHGPGYEEGFIARCRKDAGLQY